MSGIFWIQTGALIRDTFREAIARKIFWGLFGISTAIILFLLLVLRIDIVEGATATVSLLGLTPDRTVNLERMVPGVHGIIGAFLYTIGMFLAVFASSGLIPSLLEPGRVELLLSKPIGRVHLLLGRYVGNVLVVTANTVYLVLGAWVIFGAKTNVWAAEFLWTIAATVFLFSVLLAVVVLVGVAWESAALATMIPVALVLMSPVLAQEKTAIKLLSSEWSRTIWKWLYYALPKTFDIGVMTLDSIRHRPIQSWMPVWSSAIFGVVILVLALLLFRERDV